MKKLIRLGMAAVVVIATALPAMAKSWDVCLETSDLNVANTVTIAGIIQPEFFSAALPSFRPEPSQLQPYLRH